jgi:hypothetical protein
MSFFLIKYVEVHDIIGEEFDDREGFSMERE